jgi:PAS domain-containing protein
MARKLTYSELEQCVGILEHDLLAYKKAKADAVKAKEELTLLFNTVPDYIAIIDHQFKIQRVNSA